MLDIKILKENQLDFIFKYSKLEGWDVEELHIRCQHKAHPNDYFIAYKNEGPVGFILAIKHNENFGFISTFLVLKEFRKMGYANELLKYAIKHLDGCQIALNSFKKKEAIYEKFGFKNYFDQINYKFIVGSMEKKTYYTVCGFDEKLSLIDKNKYETYLLTHKKIIYKAIKNNGEISSYGLCFKYLDGYKIVIHTKKIDEAITLFFELIKKFEIGVNIYIETTKLEPILLKLTRSLNMSEHSRLSRMYNKILRAPLK